jgi:hypothetical protein
MADMMKDYVEVAERIRIFREKYPEGSLQPMNLEKPYEIVTVGEKTFIVYFAAAYRTPDDQRPGIGSAWEPVPGATSFTRLSELMVCETSAWGRAIVAVLAADAKKVATIDEVRNRAEAPVRAVAPKPIAKVVAPKPSADEPQEWVAPKQVIVEQTEKNEASIHAIAELAKQAGIASKEEMREYCSMVIDRDIASSLDLSAEDRVKVIMALRELVMDPKE